MAVDETTIRDEELEGAHKNAKVFESFPRIKTSKYHTGLELLELKLDTGHRLRIPREQLGELRYATTEQAIEVHLGPQGRSVWWPQLDDGLYLPDFLEYRWGKEIEKLAA